MSGWCAGSSTMWSSKAGASAVAVREAITFVRAHTAFDMRHDLVPLQAFPPAPPVTGRPTARARPLSLRSWASRSLTAGKSALPSPIGVCKSPSRRSRLSTRRRYALLVLERQRKKVPRPRVRRVDRHRAAKKIHSLVEIAGHYAREA